MMRTYNLFGEVELKAGPWPSAGRYEKSRELAGQLKDQVGLGQAAQNLGIVCQIEGDAARERGDEPAARRHYEAARQSVEESLRIRQSLGNKPDEAGSLSQLARIHLGLGDLAAAAHHAHAARQIRESLGLLDVWRNYDTLSEIAQARGDAAAASEWCRNAMPCSQKPNAVPTVWPSEGALRQHRIPASKRLVLTEHPYKPASAMARSPRSPSANSRRSPTGLPAELRQWLEELTQPIRDAGGDEGARQADCWVRVASPAKSAMIAITAKTADLATMRLVRSIDTQFLRRCSPPRVSIDGVW